MITRKEIQLIKRLAEKKQRRKEGLFVAEGPKVVADLMGAFRPAAIYATSEWTAQNGAANILTEEELRRASLLQHPQQVIALFHLPSPIDRLPTAADGLTIALDGVQDPGNMGTIIRIADWFGIDHIVCSQDTADAYNPKVVQATMGSLARVSISYTDLPEYLGKYDGDIYGTFLDGDDIYATELGQNGLVVMGNEGNGISAATASHIGRKLLIPNFHTSSDGADSLNVAIATAIACSEFKRRNYVKKT